MKEPRTKSVVGAGTTTDNTTILSRTTVSVLQRQAATVDSAHTETVTMPSQTAPCVQQHILPPSAVTGIPTVLPCLNETRSEMCSRWAYIGWFLYDKVLPHLYHPDNVVDIANLGEAFGFMEKRLACAYKYTVGIPYPPNVVLKHRRLIRWALSNRSYIEVRLSDTLSSAFSLEKNTGQLAPNGKKNVDMIAEPWRKRKYMNELCQTWCERLDFPRLLTPEKTLELYCDTCLSIVIEQDDNLLYSNVVRAIAECRNGETKFGPLHQSMRYIYLYNKEYILETDGYIQRLKEFLDAFPGYKVSRKRIQTVISHLCSGGRMDTVQLICKYYRKDESDITKRRINRRGCFGTEKMVYPIVDKTLFLINNCKILSTAMRRGNIEIVVWIVDSFGITGVDLMKYEIDIIWSNFIISSESAARFVVHLGGGLLADIRKHLDDVIISCARFDRVGIVDIIAKGLDVTREEMLELMTRGSTPTHKVNRYHEFCFRSREWLEKTYSITEDDIREQLGSPSTVV